MLVLFISMTKCSKGERICNAPVLRGCTVCVIVGSHMCTKGFLNYFSAIIEFFKVVFKGEIVKFSKNGGTFAIKESVGGGGGVKV